MTAPRERASEFLPRFRRDLAFWIETNRANALRVIELVEACVRDPFRGIGKPEPMKHVGPNTWSRRIDGEHRLVYVVEHDRIVFLRARHHYER